MPHLILSDASLAYGHVPLLDHAELQLDPGERVALIGRNGCGKSSLLRALAGQGSLDDGSVWRQPGIRMGYVPQEPPFDPSLTVFEAVVAGMGEVAALLAEYHAVSHAMAESPDVTKHCWNVCTRCKANWRRRMPGRSRCRRRG